MNPFASLKAGLRRALPALLLALPLALAAAEQRTFATPEAAVDALATALKANDERALVEMFGDKYKKLISTGSPADDAARRAEAATWLATFRAARRQRARPAGAAGRRQGLAVPDSAGARRQRLALRHRARCGGNPQPARRPQRAQRPLRAAGVRRRAARVRVARPRRRRRASVRGQARQQPGQVRWPVLAGRCQQEGGGEPVRPADRAKRLLPRRAQPRATPTTATTSAS